MDDEGPVTITMGNDFLVLVMEEKASFETVVARVYPKYRIKKWHVQDGERIVTLAPNTLRSVAGEARRKHGSVETPS